ncbi:MotA/TolQ/ExbB proton channel family protein [Fulvitalea axinellae]
MELLQITTSTSVADSTMMAGASDSVSVLDLLVTGGAMVIPLGLLFIAALYILMERMRVMKKASKLPNGFHDEVKRMVSSGDVNGAMLYCAQNDTPMGRMIEKGISRIGSPLKSIEASIENVGKIELYKLEKNLSLLATIAGAAPMLGFLGTVTGMIRAFIAIAQQEGTVSPKDLSTGIYEAMITTAVGLFVGIVAYLSYNFLVAKVSKLIHQMEYTSIDFIDLLQEPQKAS